MKRWYHPAFKTDLIEAARYLESKRSEYGGQFLDEAEAAIETVMKAPNTWRERPDGLRRFLVERFHYAIRFRVRNDEVEFLSVLHASRQPDTGDGRL